MPPSLNYDRRPSDRRTARGPAASSHLSAGGDGTPLATTGLRLREAIVNARSGRRTCGAHNPNARRFPLLSARQSLEHVRPLVPPTVDIKLASVKALPLPPARRFVRRPMPTAAAAAKIESGPLHSFGFIWLKSSASF